MRSNIVTEAGLPTRFKQWWEGIPFLRESRVLVLGQPHIPSSTPNRHFELSSQIQNSSFQSQIQIDADKQSAHKRSAHKRRRHRSESRTPVTPPPSFTRREAHTDTIESAATSTGWSIMEEQQQPINLDNEGDAEQPNNPAVRARHW